MANSETVFVPKVLVAGLDATKGYVSSELRLPNIVVPNEETQLVDYDCTHEYYVNTLIDSYSRTRKYPLFIKTPLIHLPKASEKHIT